MQPRSLPTRWFVSTRCYISSSSIGKSVHLPFRQTVYFIWRGATFRVPVSTLQSRLTEGGWDLEDIAAKCRARLLSRMYVQGARPGTAMAAWMHGWGLHKRIPTPPNAHAYPKSLEHVQVYAIDMEYIPLPRPEDSQTLWRKHIYRILHTMTVAASATRPLRIVTMYPNYNWPQIWINMHVAWIPDTVRSTWYMAIHDILPTRERQYRISLAESDRCSLCGSTDTLTHRIIDCGNGGEMWRWTKTRMAVILRINACYIPDDWPLRPHFHIWPRQRHEAILWMVAFFVFFRVQHSDQATLSDYADFMRRARWKAHSLPQRIRRIGNYLTAW
jgi:hypothetical protein